MQVLQLLLGVRCLLWDYLINFARNCQLLAFAGYGDLNELYCCADKNGGSLIGKVNGWRRWVDSCDIIFFTPVTSHRHYFP